MRGIIELPIEKGKSELGWVVRQAVVDGPSGAAAANPVINVTTSRDADFISKRHWLVSWPKFGTIGPVVPADVNLSLPADPSILIREGTTRRGLALTPGFAKAIAPDATPIRMISNQFGTSAPQLIRANTNLIMELARASAATIAWVGDLYLVHEGFKVYPYLP